MRTARMNFVFALAFASAWPARAGAPDGSFDHLKPQEIDSFIRQTYRSVPDAKTRFLRYSERFVGMPYGLFPLGIAPKDGVEDPAIRFDVADCTTMIETLLAMSTAPNLDEARHNMAKIRYRDGKIDLRTKNDIAESEWLPNNIRAGYLVDITRKVAGKATRINEKKIRVKEYDDAELAQLNALIKTDPPKAIEFLRNVNTLGKRFREEKASIPYVPLAELPKVGPRIPSGAIFSLVRESRPDKEIMVTHQGLIIQKADGAYVRHMAFQEKGIDVPMADYFKQYDKSTWKVVGINLTFPNRP